MSDLVETLIAYADGYADAAQEEADIEGEGTEDQRDMESIAADLREAAARITELEAENARLREALSSIDIYLTDTLTGRVLPDPATYKQWLVDGIREARKRARATRATLAGKGDDK